MVSEFGKLAVYIKGLQGPAQAKFYASKLSVRVVLAGHNCFSIRLQNYRSDLTMFSFNILEIK